MVSLNLEQGDHVFGQVVLRVYAGAVLLVRPIGVIPVGNALLRLFRQSFSLNQ
jgi:hypothetical protein